MQIFIWNVFNVWDVVCYLIYLFWICVIIVNIVNKFRQCYTMSLLAMYYFLLSYNLIIYKCDSIALSSLYSLWMHKSEHQVIRNVGHGINQCWLPECYGGIKMPWCYKTTPISFWYFEFTNCNDLFEIHCTYCLLKFHWNWYLG